MTFFRYSVFAVSLFLASACSRQTRFHRLEKQLDESSCLLYHLTTRVLDYYATDPDEISTAFEAYCCDDTFAQIDSLVMQQRQLLDSMADCCPRKLRRRLLLRTEQTCDLQRLADKAQNPFIYKEFGPKLRRNCHSEE